MQTLILQTPHINDLLIFIQLAEKLGISYVQKEVETPTFAEIPAVLHKVAKPLRKKLDIETLKKEQNYQGANRQTVQAIIEQLAIEEPLEVLLSQLTP